MFRKLLDEGQAGDNIGVLLRGTKSEEIERGQVLAKPGSITPHKKFKGEVYVLKKEEGGRHTPFFNNYRPQFYFRTTDVTGHGDAARGHRDGDAGRQHQDGRRAHHAGRLEEQLRFAIREGGRTVGAGVVTKILDDDVKSSRRRSRSSDHGTRTRHRHARLHGLQRAELLTTKNKRDDAGQARALEVLPALPQAHGAQGDEVATSSSRPLAQLVEQRIPNPQVGGSSPS